jgi:hypothetical protein
MLVDYETKMHFRLLHLAQHVFEPCGVNDIQRRLQNIFEFEFLRMQQIRHDVFAVYEPAHVVKRLSIHRQTRVAMLIESLRDLFEIAGVRNCRHLGAWHHRLAHHCVGKLEHAMYQTPLFGAEVTTLA